MEDNKQEFYFYAMLDEKKERIAKIKTNTLENAEKCFAIIKGMTIDEFRSIYRVEAVPVSSN